MYMDTQHLIKRTYSGGGFVLLCWSQWAECRIGIEQALFSSRSWGTVKADKLHANKGLKIKRKKIKNQIKIKLLNFLWGQGKERG